MSIRVLPQNLINQIAAGEVIESPASVIKELVENSLDANSNKIEITIKNAGKTYISVTDNGTGMNRNDLEKCIFRHATSKLPTDNLFDINFLGFRGEAIPSIASISNMTITTNNGIECWKIEIENGCIKNLSPASFPKGTKIEVSNLFYNVPARLNFLKTDRGETSRIIDIVERIALCHPDKTFILNDFISFYPEDKLARIAKVQGKDFKNNSIEINTTSHNLKIEGYICTPTFTRNSSAYEYLYINNRSIKDKVLFGVLKAAYMDTMEKGKFPSVCLWLTLPNSEIDVNVHPQKAEIRFKEQNFIKGTLINVIRRYIATAPINPNVIDPKIFIHSDDSNINKNTSSFNTNAYIKQSSNIYSWQNLNTPNQVCETQTIFNTKEIPPSVNPATIKSDSPNWEDFIHYPLGTARGQFHNTYIISEIEDGIIIMDQHACHERITYEKIKKQIEEGGIKRQLLLIPEIVELDPKRTNALLDSKTELEKFGLVIDAFSPTSIIIYEIPAIIINANLQNLIKQIAEDINNLNKEKILENKMAMISKTYACHTSIRAGKSLTIDEMNELLRQVEKNENAPVCNHGRRSYIKLNLKDLGKLFDR